MSLSRLFWWIYQLSPGRLLCLLMLCTGAFFWLHREMRGCPRWRGGMAVLLVIWAGAALWSTILNRSGGTMGAFRLMPFHSYREVLAGGNREILRSNFMNVVLFYPAGLLTASLLPEQWLHRRKLLVTVIVFALFSLAIECTQAFCALGRPEIDDVLHNTLGAVLGCLALFRSTR